MEEDTSAVKAALTAALGSIYEWYDFAVYGYLASDIAANFFGGSSSRLALLEAFAVYGAAFVMRPLGALLFGRVGDTAGRRGALLGAVALMALPSFVIGCLPTYAAIGQNATILLVCCRLLQGVSVGGQVAGAFVMTVELAPPGSRGLAGALATAGNSLGVALGAAVVTACKASLGERASRRARARARLSLIHI